MNNILLLASSSQSRRRLLGDASFPFVLVDQDADETQCDWGLPLQQLVASIAAYKMEHVMMPKGQDGQELFVLTADTLTQGPDGAMLGKPVTRNHAHQMIRDIAQSPVVVGTGFCLDKKVFQFDRWQIAERIEGYAEAQCEFYVPEKWQERYLDTVDYTSASGSMLVEGFGAQFLKSVDGSYSAIQGLPLFEVRQALKKLGFY